MYSRPRFNRGTSVIAALVFAALLGAVALGLHAFQSGSTNTAGLSASAVAGEQSASANPQAAQPQTMSDNQSCATVVATANSSQQETPPSTIVDKSADVADSCNAAAVDATQSTASKQMFKCVGKSGEMIDDGNGTYTEDLHTDTAVPAGKCNVQICTTAGKCNATQQLNGISSASIASALTTSQIANVTPDQGLTFPDQPTPPATPSQTSLTCNGEVCAPLTTGTDPRLDLAQGQTPPAAPGGENIDCDANPTACPDSQTAAEQKNDPNTYCYDGGKTCYPPSTETDAYIGASWNCSLETKGDPNSGTVCTAPATAGTQIPAAPTPGPSTQAPGTQTPNTQTPGSKAPTFSAPQQTQAAAQQNNCNIISSILGGCSGSGLSCQLTISPNPPQQGMPANLTWTSSGNVYSGTISGVGNISGPSGSYTVYPTPGAVYTMTVTGQNNSGTAQCSTNVNSTAQTGCTGSSSCQSAQTPYGVGTNGQACSQPPAQPAASSCTTGSWQPVSAANNGCVTSYQCGGQTAGAPTAQISCSPQVADVGMSVAISYSCANATGSSASGFTTGNQTSGSTTTVITAPPSGTNTANFGLTCTNGAQASGAQCSVQINQAAIVLVANPLTVPSGQISSIGWVTTGMQACVISSPDDDSFTAANASNQSVNGVAQTDAITGDTEFDLTCTTLGGLTKTASTIVSVGSATSTTP